MCPHSESSQLQFITAVVALAAICNTSVLAPAAVLGDCNQAGTRFSQDATVRPIRLFLVESRAVVHGRILREAWD